MAVMDHPIFRLLIQELILAYPPSSLCFCICKNRRTSYKNRDTDIAILNVLGMS